VGQPWVQEALCCASDGYMAHGSTPE